MVQIRKNEKKKLTMGRKIEKLNVSQNDNPPFSSTAAGHSDRCLGKDPQKHSSNRPASSVFGTLANRGKTPRPLTSGELRTCPQKRNIHLSSVPGRTEGHTWPACPSFPISPLLPLTVASADLGRLVKATKVCRPLYMGSTHRGGGG